MPGLCRIHRGSLLRYVSYTLSHTVRRGDVTILADGDSGSVPDGNGFDIKEADAVNRPSVV